jgi:hypothetical protein
MSLSPVLYRKQSKHRLAGVRENGTGIRRSLRLELANPAQAFQLVVED